MRTTGHTSDAEGGRDFLGKPLDAADGVLKCLFCHTTNAHAVLSRTGPEATDRAIGCERCHGPGGNHLKAVAARFSDPAIVSPAQGSGEGSLRLCAQCHALHDNPSLPRTDPYWIRFQGTTLPWSRCYTESAGALDCVTCHDPHRNAERSAAYYEARCLSCHSKASSSGPPSKTREARPSAIRQGSTCPINASSKCLDCHMPPFRSEPLHATFTDHYIRVRPELKTGDQAREGARDHAREGRAMTTPVRASVQTGAAPNLGREADPIALTCEVGAGVTPALRVGPSEPLADASRHDP